PYAAGYRSARWRRIRHHRCSGIVRPQCHRHRIHRENSARAADADHQPFSSPPVLRPTRIVGGIVNRIARGSIGKIPLSGLVPRDRKRFTTGRCNCCGALRRTLRESPIVRVKTTTACRATRATPYAGASRPPGKAGKTGRQFFLLLGLWPAAGLPLANGLTGAAPPFLRFLSAFGFFFSLLLRI